MRVNAGKSVDYGLGLLKKKMAYGEGGLPMGGAGVDGATSAVLVRLGLLILVL
jgi:hypothetical protein